MEIAGSEVWAVSGMIWGDFPSPPPLLYLYFLDNPRTSGERMGRHVFSWVWQKQSFSKSGPPLHLKMGTDPSAETPCSLRQWTKSRNLAIISIMYHDPNLWELVLQESGNTYKVATNKKNIKNGNKQRSTRMNQYIQRFGRSGMDKTQQ
jgi:hypothetical protein